LATAEVFKLSRKRAGEFIAAENNSPGVFISPQFNCSQLSFEISWVISPRGRWLVLFPATAFLYTQIMKQCTICKQVKDKDQFPKHSGHKDGLSSLCRGCTTELARNRKNDSLIQKACQTCKILKPLTDFYRKTNSPLGVQGECRICQRKRSAARLLLKPKPAKVHKIVAVVEPELIIDVPGIFEIQNRGKNYTTYNFTNPIDQSTFTFSSFHEARQARESMRDVFIQQARFEAVVRQKTGKKPVDDEDAE
jgi:hypothetical protein